MKELLVVTVFIGVPLIVLGYLMKRYKLVEVIAGYDPKKVTDLEGLANWVGNNLMLMGFLGIAVGFIQTVLDFSPLHSILVYLGVILLLCVRTVFGTKRFEQ